MEEITRNALNIQALLAVREQEKPRVFLMSVNGIRVAASPNSSGSGAAFCAKLQRR